MKSLNTFMDLFPGIYGIIKEIKRILKEIFEILKDSEGYH